MIALILHTAIKIGNQQFFHIIIDLYVSSCKVERRSVMKSTDVVR